MPPRRTWALSMELVRSRPMHGASGIGERLRADALPTGACKHRSARDRSSCGSNSCDAGDGEDDKRHGEGRVGSPSRPGLAVPGPRKYPRQSGRPARHRLSARVIHCPPPVVDVVARAHVVPVASGPAHHPHLLHRHSRQPTGPVRHRGVVRRLDALHEQRPSRRSRPPPHSPRMQCAGSHRRASSRIRGHSRHRVGSRRVLRIHQPLHRAHLRVRRHPR